MIDFQIKIAGAAGEGVMAIGLLAAKAFSRAGLFVFNYNEYPSLIRGGHNTAIVRATDFPIGSIRSKIEILVALNSESFELHDLELIDGGILLWDQKEATVHHCPRLRHCIHVPLRELATQIGNPIVINTIALGSLAASLNFPLEYINQAIKGEFSQKGKEIVDLNQKAAKSGYDFIKKNYKANVPADLGKLIKDRKSKKDESPVVISGNEAISLGAIAANCQFYAGYPMTPSTGIFHTLAQLGPKVGLTFKQTEDEISAVNMVIGAWFAGKRAMTATSGGGFALMTEAIGLAAMTETPLVIAQAMRPGPATGLPTWTEQGDLRQVLHAGQGDFPRLVLTPGDSEESLRLTHLAFQLAEEFQIPSIVLTDKYLAESFMTTFWPKSQDLKNDSTILSDEEAEKKKDYQRYKITDSGISPRAIPGQKNSFFIANSDEHNPDGFSTEKAEMRNMMMEKRMRKLEKLKARIDQLGLFEIYPRKSKNSQITLFSFGSNKWPVKEAVDELRSKKINALAFHCQSIWPLPSDIAYYFHQSPINICLENNISGQFEGLLKEHWDLSFDSHLRKFDGRPFLAEEIVKQVLAIKKRLS